jgi:CHAT domain-containing protein
MGDNRRAEPILQRELAIVEQKYGPNHPRLCPALQNLGIIARQKKDYDHALELLSRSLGIKEKAFGRWNVDTAGLLVNIANVYSNQGQVTKSLKQHLEALEILETVGGPHHASTLLELGNVARAFAAVPDIPKAIEYEKRFNEVLEKNIAMNLAIGSDREKLAYLRSWSFRTDRTISLHVRQAADQQAAAEVAILALLQRKGRALDAMSTSIRELRERLGPEDQKLFDELGEANAHLARVALGGPGKTPMPEYRKQLATLESHRDRLEAAISGRSAEFRAQTQPVTLEGIRATIPPGAALIELARFHSSDARDGEIYQDSAANYVAYVVHREGDVQCRDLGPIKDIDDGVAAFRAALGDPHRKDVANLARALDRKIGQPIRAMAADANQLLIAPEGSLNLIPFEALIDEQGRYLLERYSIHYLTAGRDLLRMQVPRPSRNRPLIIADPLFGEPVTLMASARRRSITTAPDLAGVYFAALPGTAQEAQDIHALLPNAQVLTGSRAAKAALTRIDAPSILHIATHGFFLESSKIANPLLRSGVALAGANRNTGGGSDGILTALEASSLNLWGTKIVTLSACETGIGEVKNGEGVYGLRRAFFLAGAETLVMSLWPVNDRVTHELMTAYYTGLKQGLGRGEALRQSQMAMLRHPGHEHPYYWAGFIQAGDWKRLDPTLLRFSK